MNSRLHRGVMEKEKVGKKGSSSVVEEGEEDTEDVDPGSSSAEITNSQAEGSSAAAVGRRNKKITKAVKDILTNNNTKFMSNFDPELSNRERRKLNRKFNGEGKKNGSVYDENGVLNGLDKDVCDCLTESCPGCHFPCPKCRSCKCGVDCRINRKWAYEVIENTAEMTLTKNINVPPG